MALLLTLPSVSFSYEGDPITNAVKDLGRLREAPKVMSERSNIYLAAGIAVTGVIIYSLDSRIIQVAQHNIRSATLDDIAKNAEKMGDGLYDAVLLAGVAGAGYAFKDDKLKDTAYLAAESFAAANTVGLALKYSIGRARPYTGHGRKTFRPFSFKNSYASFPSGHTTSAFSIASVFAARYDSTLLGILVYSAASSTALQRIYSDKHWPTDVFAGAVIGTVTGRAVVRFSKDRSGKSVLLLPVYEPGYSGLTASVRF
ncbi:MAG: phosphatase PAP2 family protein [Elusimicrobia bacterium]|nr:phosphatase PAP2 family protein [Elusimicrobiota bacterium]